jgi:hypothetical protein
MEAFPAAVPNETKQLDIVQNQALKIITGGVKTTSITAMEIYTGIEPLNARRDSAVMVLHDKLCRLDTSCETPHIARLKTHKTFIERVNEIKSEYELDVLENRKEHITLMPLSNTVIDIEYEIKIEGMEHKKSTYSEHELKAHTLRYIHSRYPTGAWIQVYTDGSATPGIGSVGAGIYCNLIEKSIAAGKYGSNFDGEVMAFWQALKGLNKQHLAK